jgi:hypothetical protein
MSLIRPILRATAVAALRDRTWAADRVYDSDLTPLSVAVYGGPPQPYIVVYTDLDDINPVDNIAKVYASDNRILSLAIEVGIASAVRNQQNDIVIQFAATDSGMEWACDVVSSQVMAALVGDTKSEWGELFKRLVTKVRRIPSRRGGMSQQGVRFAARRITFQVQPLWDFIPGQRPPAVHPVWDFIALAKANPEVNIVDVAGIIEGLIDIDSLPDWRVAQSQLGLTQDGIEALNVGSTPLPPPYVDDEDLDVPVPMMTVITVSDTEDGGLSTTVTYPVIAVGSPDIDMPTMTIVSTMVALMTKVGSPVFTRPTVTQN